MNIVPEIGAALIGGGASLLGNLFNFGSQSSANSQNLKIAQMNNEFNERMMEKQMAYNTDMFNKQNQWNSATAQRKRLEQAGLNPYLMLNGGNAGTAANSLGVTAPTAAPASVVAPQLDTSSIGESVRNIISASATKESNDNLRMLTKTGYDLANFEKVLKDAMAGDYLKSRELKEQQRQQLERLNILEDSNLNSLELELRNRSVEQQFKALYQREQVTSMILQNAFQAARLPYADIFASNEAAMQAAEIMLAYSSGALNKAKAKEALANVTLIGKMGKKIDAETTSVGNQNKLFDKVFDVTVNAIKSQKYYLDKLYEGYGNMPVWYYTLERLGLSPGAVKQDIKDAGQAIIGAAKK